MWEFDDVVCVTGSYAVTGDLLQMNIQSKDGQLLIDKGKDGIETYLGVTVSGFQNMFFTYGPQAPTALECIHALVRIRCRTPPVTV